MAWWHEMEKLSIYFAVNAVQYTKNGKFCVKILIFKITYTQKKIKKNLRGWCMIQDKVYPGKDCFNFLHMIRLVITFCCNFLGHFFVIYILSVCTKTKIGKIRDAVTTKFYWIITYHLLAKVIFLPIFSY